MTLEFISTLMGLALIYHLFEKVKKSDQLVKVKARKKQHPFRKRK